MTLITINIRHGLWYTYTHPSPKYLMFNWLHVHVSAFKTKIIKIFQGAPTSLQQWHTLQIFHQMRLTTTVATRDKYNISDEIIE